MTEPNSRNNFELRDEIKAYWSARAATFDQQPGHEIFSEAERAAWHGLLARHLGVGKGRSALDLASGTGVVSHLMDDLGFRVTGLDWAEPMIERARKKAISRGRAVTFRLGDAERTMEPDDRYDVVVNRHLVWTLVDPAAAFAEWIRVLKPGGTLLIIDGDFVNRSPFARIMDRLEALAASFGMNRTSGNRSGMAMQTHRDILARVHFSNGAKAHAVVALLEKAGFADISVDTDMRAIHRTQARNFSLLKALERATQHRYTIVARKP